MLRPATFKDRLRTVTATQVALAALVLYGAYALAAVSVNGAGSFASVGPWVLRQSAASPTIEAHLHPNDRFGYDGEFYTAIALDPAKGHFYMDRPGYRYSRILYPMVARVVALGQAGWIPTALIIVNLLAVAGGTFCVAKLLAQNDSPPALAALYFLFPGLCFAFVNDLAEPLAYALAALGLVLLDAWRTPTRVIPAAAAFALAGLTREGTLIIPITLALVQGARVLQRRERLRPVLGFALITAVPYLAWGIFVYAWLGTKGGTPASLSSLPFSGLSHARDGWPLLAVAIPVAALLVPGVTALVRERWNANLVGLAVSLLVFGLYLPAQSYHDYVGAGRLQLGALLLVLASLRALTRTPFSSQLTVCAGFFAYLPLVTLIANLASSGFAPIA